MSRKQNQYDLTEDEIAYLRSADLTEDVKGYLLRQHDNIGTKYSAFRKVALAARAECDAVLATRDLAAAKGMMTDLAEVRRQAELQKRRADALEAKVSEKDETILQLMAGPALAVHSDG